MIKSTFFSNTPFKCTLSANDLIPECEKVLSERQIPVSIGDTSATISEALTELLLAEHTRHNTEVIERFMNIAMCAQVNGYRLFVCDGDDIVDKYNYMSKYVKVYAIMTDICTFLSDTLRLDCHMQFYYNHYTLTTSILNHTLKCEDVSELNKYSTEAQYTILAGLCMGSTNTDQDITTMHLVRLLTLMKADGYRLQLSPELTAEEVKNKCTIAILMYRVNFNTLLKEFKGLFGLELVDQNSKTDKEIAMEYLQKVYRDEGISVALNVLVNAINTATALSEPLYVTKAAIQEYIEREWSDD